MRSLASLATIAVATLYREHNNWLCGWLVRRVGCSQSAADLAQDTFLRLLKSDRLPMLAEPRAYLSTIAQGLLIDQYRRRRIEQAYLASAATLADEALPSEEQRLDMN